MAPPTDTLSNTPPPPAEAPPPAADTREQVRQATQGALQDLRDRVEERGSDFSTDKVFGKIQADLAEFFAANHTADAPEDIQKAWRDTVIQFMTTEIAAYSGSLGEMTIDAANAAIAAVKDPNQKSPKGQTGIGSFEYWITHSAPQNLKDQYEKWKAEKAQQAEAQTKEQQDQAAQAEVQRKQGEAVEAQKQELLNGTVANLETRLNVISAIAPTLLSDEIKNLRKQITDDDGKKLADYRATAAALELKIKAVEDLKPLAENPDIPEARKNEILALVREGKKDPAEAKRDLEAALQGANLPVAVDEDAPIGDRLLGWAGALPDGPMKKLALGLASFFATLCTTKWIGGWFRGKLMSNRTLAEKFGDAEAAKAVKVEQEFRRFGLPENLVSDLGKKKTKEVLALLRQKPAEITKDTAQQGKLAKLADNIEAKGGVASDDTLTDFMSNGNIWKDIVYPGATAGAVATAASETAPTQAQNIPAESPDTKIAKIFEGMTADKKAALENAKAKEVAAGTLPDLIKDDDRTKKIAAKLKTNGADQITDSNQTVRQFIETNLDKDWNIA